MTIKDIIDLQERTDTLYLLRQGLLYWGYGQAAAFLHDALGYKLVVQRLYNNGKRGGSLF